MRPTRRPRKTEQFWTMGGPSKSKMMMLTKTLKPRPIRGAEPQYSPWGAELEGQSIVLSLMQLPAPPAQLLMPERTKVAPMRVRTIPEMRGGNICEERTGSEAAPKVIASEPRERASVAKLRSQKSGAHLLNRARRKEGESNGKDGDDGGGTEEGAERLGAGDLVSSSIEPAHACAVGGELTVDEGESDAGSKSEVSLRTWERAPRRGEGSPNESERRSGDSEDSRADGVSEGKPEPRDLKASAERGPDETSRDEVLLLAGRESSSSSATEEDGRRDETANCALESVRVLET
jgi:hypothetical protein